MSLFFNPNEWHRVTASLTPQLISELKMQALEITSRLPSLPSEKDFGAGKELFAQFQASIKLARQQSNNSGAWPKEGATSLELALWAAGLARLASR